MIFKKKSTAVTINEPQDLKVRPIVEGPKYPTRKLTELIHILLKPFLKHIKSYTRDRIDFSNKFDKNTDENVYITTTDVCTVWNEESKACLMKLRRRDPPEF